MSFRNRNQVYLTSCRKCGGTTSKSFAKHNDGRCKNCTLPKCGAEYNRHCLTPAHIGECATHRPVGSGLRSSDPKCPDCGGPIAAWKLRKGYHCDACTRAIEGPAYFQNETSYEGGTITLFKDGGLWIASHSGPGSEDILKLFGTTDIPTAFTEKAHPYKVFSEIERLNPTHEVKFGS